VDGTVSLDVNDVTNLVGLQVGGQRDSTMLSEVPLEHVTSTRSVTVTITIFLFHFTSVTFKILICIYESTP